MRFSFDRTGKRIDNVNARFDEINNRLEALDHKLDGVLATVNRIEQFAIVKFSEVETRLSRIEAQLFHS